MEKNELSVSNNIKHQVKKRVNLVDRELEVLQWTNFFSIEPTSNYSKDASLKCWGAVCNGVQTGKWSQEERTLQINAWTTSKKIGSIFLHQREKGENHTLSDRQLFSLVFPFENGGTKKEHLIKLSNSQNLILTLVLMWNSTQRKKVNFCFSRDFCRY